VVSAGGKIVAEVAVREPFGQETSVSESVLPAAVEHCHMLMASQGNLTREFSEKRGGQAALRLAFRAIRKGDYRFAHEGVSSQRGRATGSRLL
jgi:hypothetical protein